MQKQLPRREKKVFLEILWNSHEYACARVSKIIKLKKYKNKSPLKKFLIFFDILGNRIF